MKTNSGFTLIEVMLAMGVLTTSLFVISEIMIRSLSKIQENQDNLEKIFLIKRELYLNFLKPKIEDKRIVSKIENPAMTLVTTLEAIKPKSELKEYKDSLKFMQTNAIWKLNQKQKECLMASIVFKPKEPEAKK